MSPIKELPLAFERIPIQHHPKKTHSQANFQDEIETHLSKVVESEHYPHSFFQTILTDLEKLRDAILQLDLKHKSDRTHKRTLCDEIVSGIDCICSNWKKREPQLPSGMLIFVLKHYIHHCKNNFLDSDNITAEMNALVGQINNRLTFFHKRIEQKIESLEMNFPDEDVRKEIILFQYFSTFSLEGVHILTNHYPGSIKKATPENSWRTAFKEIVDQEFDTALIQKALDQYNQCVSYFEELKQHFHDSSVVQPGQALRKCFNNLLTSGDMKGSVRSFIKSSLEITAKAVALREGMKFFSPSNYPVYPYLYWPIEDVVRPKNLTSFKGALREIRSIDRIVTEMLKDLKKCSVEMENTLSDSNLEDLLTSSEHQFPLFPQEEYTPLQDVRGVDITIRPHTRDQIRAKLYQQYPLAEALYPEDPQSKPLEDFLTTTKELGDTSYSVVEAKGNRPRMEDAWLAEEVKLDDTIAIPLYAVLDGHGGNFASEWTKRILPDLLRIWLHHAREQIKKNQIENEVDRHGVIRNAMELLGVHLNHILYDVAELSLTSQGTTLTFCFPYKGTLFTVNIGDSRAIFKTDSKVLQLSQDAKTDDPLFQSQFIKAGVQIDSNGRVPGESAGGVGMARALGDFNIKKGLSDRPKVHAMPLQSGTLLIGSDGIFDSLGTQQVADHIDPKVKLFLGLEKIVQEAYQKGSQDNMTLLAVQLQ